MTDFIRACFEPIYAVMILEQLLDDEIESTLETRLFFREIVVPKGSLPVELVLGQSRSSGSLFGSLTIATRGSVLRSRSIK